MSTNNHPTPQTPIPEPPTPIGPAREVPAPEVPAPGIGKVGGRGRTLAAGVRRRLSGDAGMNTAEYAVGTIAAVAFAGILLKVLTSGTVQAALSAIIQRALG
jgi:hypothetical protein